MSSATAVVLAARSFASSRSAAVVSWSTAARSASWAARCERPGLRAGGEPELAQRRAACTPPAQKDERGYRRLYEDHVLRANEGCDLDFLRGRSPVLSDAVTYL